MPVIVACYHASMFYKCSVCEQELDGIVVVLFEGTLRPEAHFECYLLNLLTRKGIRFTSAEDVGIAEGVKA